MGKLKSILVCVMLSILCDAMYGAVYTREFTENDTVYLTSSGASDVVIGGTTYSGLGNITVNNGCTVNFVFNTSNLAYFAGTIRVNNGTLKMSMGPDYSGSHSVLKRASGYHGELFRVANTTTDVNSCQLEVSGTPSTTFVIDGNASYTLSGSNESGWTATPSGQTGSSLLTMSGGKATMNYVCLRNNNCNYTSDATDYLYYSQNTIALGDRCRESSNTWTNAKTENILSLSNSSISNCYANRYCSAINIGNTSLPENGKNSSIILTNCTIEKCFSNAEASGSSGTIRAFGTTRTTLRMVDCTLKNNIHQDTGGSLVWNAGLVDPMELIHCTIDGNYSKNDGGGISATASFSLERSTISNNYAVGNGGGIVYGTYGGPSNIVDFGFKNGTMTIDSETSITGNTAKTGQGGGLYYNIAPIIVGTPAKTYFSNINGTQYEKSLIINGATISGNKASRGGAGIAIYRTTRIYKSDLQVNYGTIENNISAGDGGAIYVYSSNESTYQGTCPYDLTDMSVSFGSTSGELKLVNNQAANGGGAYITGDFLITKIVNGTIGEQGKSNIATGGNGGGIYVGGGNISVSGGTVSYNDAIQSSSIVGTGMGGAVFVNSGNITINGGTIQKNHAERNGGAIYTNGGATTIKGGEIANNTADFDGGAMYLNGDLTFESGTLESNTATNNGGGAFVNGGTVTFNNGTLKFNEALNGGGIYLASGASMTFTDGLIAKNHALKNGNDITTAYNAKSTVSTVNGCGGGIYLQSGASDDKKTALTINVVNNFGLYGNTADRAGDDIVAEGVNTSVTVPNVTSMDLKDFEGKDAQPNWYEDYVYVQGGSDSGYAGHSILKYSGGSGKRFQQMLIDGSGDIYNHLVTFNESSRTFPTSAGNDGYVCLSLGYTVLSAIIRATGLNEKESMYFTLEQLVLKEGTTDQWIVRNTYPVLLSGTTETFVQRVVRNLMPGEYRVTQFKAGDTPWAWAYTVTNPSDGVIQKKVTKEDSVNNLFPFTVKHVEGDPNVLHDEEYKVNKMLDNAAIVPNIGVEDYKKKNDVHVKF